MKQDIKAQPNIKLLLTSLFTKFFRDHLLTQKEHQRDKEAYLKNFDLWQKFVKVIDQDSKQDESGSFSNNHPLIQELVSTIHNYKQDQTVQANYLEEVQQILSSPQCQSNHTSDQNIKNNQKKIERPQYHYQKRQLSIPPKPSLIRGDSIVEEEKPSQEYNYKQGQSLRTHKKNNTAILSQTKFKQIKETNQCQAPKSPSNIQHENQKINKNINMQSCQNIFSGIQSIHQKSTHRVVEDSQNTFLELQDFLKQKNTRNIQEITQNLMQEQIFKQSKNIYILKCSNACTQNMNMMNQFIYAVSIQHYQNLIQNSSLEKWQQIIKFFQDEKSFSSQQNLIQDVNKSNKMTSQQKLIMTKLFSEMSESIQRKDKTQQAAFSEFLQKAQNDEILAQCLLVSLKEKIVSTCKLEESESFRNEIFNNWFVKNPNTNLVGIDSQKLKLLSYSLLRRISILKVTQTINSQQQIYSNSSLETIQSFDQPSDINFSIPYINILWHNTHQFDHFYLILNDQQYNFYQNKDQQKYQSPQYPFIQTKEISLNKCISEMQSSSTQPQLHISKQISESSGHPQSSNSISSLLSLSQKKQKEDALIEKYASSTSSLSKLCNSMEPKFSQESNLKLKQKVQQLKLMMIDNSFSINSIQMQMENNWTPLNQLNQQKHIGSPSMPFHYQEQQIQKIDLSQYKTNQQQPNLKPLNDFSNLNINSRYSSNMQIQILKNQDQDLIRGRENCSNQIKILNQCSSFRSASQNNFIKHQEQKPLINILNNQINNQSQITHNISQSTKHQIGSQARLRVQSGHVASASKLNEDYQEYSGITILGQQSQKRNISPFINLKNDESNINLIKLEENKKEDSSDKYRSNQNYDSLTSQFQIQFLNKQLKNNLNAKQVEDSDKSVLKLLGLTSSASSNSTSSSNTTSTTNIVNNYISGNSYSQQQQASFFLKNSPNYMNNINNNSPQADSGIKLIKSQSTNQNNIQFTNPKQIPSINDFRFYQEFLLQSKQSTPNQNCIKNQQINHKHITLQQNLVKS